MTRTEKRLLWAARCCEIVGGTAILVSQATSVLPSLYAAVASVAGGAMMFAAGQIRQWLPGAPAPEVKP